MIDISCVARKAHAAKYAASFEPSVGMAGYANTRREPLLLSDRQHRLVEQFAVLIPKERRSVYRAAVHARLSGAPGDAACRSAAINAASSGYIELGVLRELGMIMTDSHGYKIPVGIKVRKR
jgi:hypothetical protein